MPRSQSDKKDDKKAATLIVTLNIFGFIFIYFSPNATREVVESLIVLPKNLLNGNYYCLVTSGFIHSSFLHLFCNMLGVVAFGRVVQRHLGFIKTLYVYFGALTFSLLFATLVNYYVLEREIAIVGASGAVMGLLAAAMLLDPFAVTYEMIVPIPVMFKGWLFFYADLKGLLNPKPDGISHLTHMFGFFSIGLLVYFLSKKEKRMMRDGLIANIFSLVLFFVVWLFYFHFKAIS